MTWASRSNKLLKGSEAARFLTKCGEYDHETKDTFYWGIERMVQRQFLSPVDNPRTPSDFDYGASHLSYEPIIEAAADRRFC